MHAPRSPITTLAPLVVAMLVAAASGCTSAPTSPPPQSPDGTPAALVPLPAAVTPLAHAAPLARGVGGHVPVSGGMFLESGDFTLEGEAVPGTASFDGAVVWDARSEQEPTTVGAGAFAVTIGGTLYQAGAAESLAFVVPDDYGATDYLVLGVYALETDASGVEVGSVVYVIVPAADFAVGATVSLDGSERLALFGWGPLDSDTPQVAGAAVAGQLTFVSGSLAAGATITATLAADFAAATWPAPTDPEDPPATDPVNHVVPGAYSLGFTLQALAYCEGSLAGKEADFTALLPSAVGLADGPVTVSIPDPARMVLTGDVLTGAFGAPSLGLDWLGDPSWPGLFIGWVETNATGPLATTRSVTYLALDGESATPTSVQAAGAAQYDDRAGGGWCDVQWDATLTAVTP